MQSNRKRGLIWVGAGVLVVFFLWHWVIPLFRSPPAVKAPPAIPADVAQVERRDVPIYVDGLGTVQAFYTVTVTARVDGQIERVAFEEGQEVKKGALLAQIDPRPYQAALDQALAAQDKDAASLANAKRDFARYAQLAPDQLTSRQTLDTQQSLVSQLKAQLKGDLAAIESARTQLAYTTITSPIAGRTGIRMVDPGNNVHSSDTTGIVVVTQLQPISVIFSLPEDAFEEVNDALNRGAVVARALSRDRMNVLDSGTVTLIDNQIDQTTGTLRIKATFANQRGALWPGQFVNVQVLTQIKRQALTMPAAALQRGPDGVFAYRVRADATVAAAPVTASEPVGDLVIVETGLQAGDRVVASNQYRLQPDSRVRANPPSSTAGQPAQSAAKTLHSRAQ